MILLGLSNEYLDHLLHRIPENAGGCSCVPGEAFAARQIPQLLSAPHPPIYRPLPAYYKTQMKRGRSPEHRRTALPAARNDVRHGSLFRIGRVWFRYGFLLWSKITSWYKSFSSDILTSLTFAVRFLCLPSAPQPKSLEKSGYHRLSQPDIFCSMLFE